MPKTLRVKGNTSIHFLSDLIRNGCDFHEIDLSNVFFITPPLVVVCKYLEIQNRPIIKPSRQEVTEYLDYMCLNRPINDKYSKSGYIPCFQVQDEKEVWSITKKFLYFFDDFVDQHNKMNLSYVISELMENVFHHANSSVGVLVHAQKYPKQNYLEIAILDDGVGIDKSLKENQQYRNLSDFEAFKKAFELSVTRNPLTNAGEGLSSVKLWIEYNELAEGVVISNEFIWFKIVAPEGIACNFHQMEHLVWPGTLIWLRIPRKPENHLEDIWNLLGLES